MSTSIATNDYKSPAAMEAFALLNAGLKTKFRGYGDTKTAARDRAAREAGVTSAEAERLWKHWRTMTRPNGDVYRNLRNTYGHLCSWIENAADAVEAKRLKIEESHEADTGAAPTGAGNRSAAQGGVEAEKEMR